jgi:hypothetical protein
MIPSYRLSYSMLQHKLLRRNIGASVTCGLPRWDRLDFDAAVDSKSERKKRDAAPFSPAFGRSFCCHLVVIVAG